MNATITFDDMNKGWPLLVEYCLADGRFVKPRGYPTREVGPTMFVLTDPSRAALTLPARKCNHAFGAAEFCWVMAGQDEVETLAFFNSKMRDFADQPPALGRSSARLFGAYGVPVTAQAPYVLENLRRDPDSRQAVITIWRPSPPATRDVPCTVMLQYLLRDGRLNALTVMRSNDLVLGTVYDVPLFARIQAWFASQLGVGLGTYTHVAGSLHVYERDLDLVRECLRPQHVPLRNPELVVGEFDAATRPSYVWEHVEAIVANEPRCTSFRRGWDKLVHLMEQYASHKRERESLGG